jgi:hypothetical protein
MKFKLLLSTFLLIGGFLCIHSFAQQRFPEFAALPEQRELPDPLKMLNGKMVATKGQWNRQELYPPFNDHPARLPFDQNALVALMAPCSAAREAVWLKLSALLQRQQSQECEMRDVKT